MKKKYNIEGMTCSACSAAIERNIKKIEGINNVNVSLLTNSMLVDFDDQIVNNEMILNSVSKAGYQANSDDIVVKTDEDGQLKTMQQRLIVSFVFLIPLMYLAMGHMFGWPLPAFFIDKHNMIAFVFTQFLLMMPIVLVNYKYFTVGFKALIQRSPNMDSLVAIGSSAAVLYGIFAIYMISYGMGHQIEHLVMHYSMDLYFESAGTILTLITLGKYLEAKAKRKTTDAIKKLIALRPLTAIIRKDDQEIEVMVDDVLVDDLVVIKPGMVIPVDGIVVEGRSTVDESALTGESMPVLKSIDDVVISATLNQNGYLVFKATKVKEDTTLSQIIQLVEQAASSKAPIAKMVDKISGVFVPIVMLIALISVIVWTLLGYDAAFVLSMGISVLIISCPCALGLATPVAIMVATGLAAKEGILIKSSEALEKAHEVDTIVLDKTGTITHGKPEVTTVFAYNNYDHDEIIRLAASVELKSEHPLATAIVEKANKHKLVLSDTSDIEVIVGMGIKAKIDDQVISIGNIALFNEAKINVNASLADVALLEDQANTPLYVGVNETLIGVIGVADQIKLSSIEAIKRLALKHEVIMLTGDNKRTAEAIGKQLAVKSIIAEVLPDQKQQVIIDLQATGKKVAMVGDGINDAIALTRADIGIAIGAGSDIAIESADIILMKNDLNNVADVIRISDKTITNIKQNLFWAFIYNVIGIPIAAGLLYPFFEISLSPMFAAFAMSFSSVSVVTNALRLRYTYKK